MSSASVSPVSTSETSSSVEDRFAWENCRSNLVLMRNCAARLANSDDPSRVFRSVSRRVSHMVSISSKARCVAPTALPLHKGNFESLPRLLSEGSSAVLFSPFWLEQSHCFQLGTWY